MNGPVKVKGNAVGIAVKGITLNDCKELCNANIACESFAYAAKKDTCYLKDKKLTGTEALAEESTQYFSVRKTCQKGNRALTWNYYHLFLITIISLLS